MPTNINKIPLDTRSGRNCVQKANKTNRSIKDMIPKKVHITKQSTKSGPCLIDDIDGTCMGRIYEKAVSI